MAIKRSIDINRQPINEPIEVEPTPQMVLRGPFDWKQASITIVLAIVALWSAYYATRILAQSSSPKTTTAKDTATTTTDTSATPKNTPTTNSTNTPTQASTSNPFSPITPEDSSKTTTTSSGTTTTDTQAVAKDSFNIRILNGNGVTGDAAGLKTSLTKDGFKVGTVSNAKLKYDKTQVYYIAGKQKEAELVVKSLTDRQTELKEADPSLVGTDYQVLVVTGKS